jgi:hypothetical protein
VKVRRKWTAATALLIAAFAQFAPCVRAEELVTVNNPKHYLCPIKVFEAKKCVEVAVQRGTTPCYLYKAVDKVYQCNITAIRSMQQESEQRNILIQLKISSKIQDFKLYFKDEKLYFQSNSGSVIANSGWDKTNRYMCFNEQLCVNAISKSDSKMLTALPLD